MDPFIEWLLMDLLRIKATAISGVFINDIVNLILLPSVVLLIFLVSAAEAFLGTGKIKWKTLIALTFYLVIIVQGWYGPFAMFAANYILLFIIAAFTMFAITSFVPMKYWRAGMVVTTKYGEKAQDIKRLQNELDLKKKERTRTESYINQAQAAGRPEDVQMWTIMLHEISREIDRLEARLKEMKKLP